MLCLSPMNVVELHSDTCVDYGCCADRTTLACQDGSAVLWETDLIGRVSLLCGNPYFIAVATVEGACLHPC